MPADRSNKKSSIETSGDDSDGSVVIVAPSARRGDTTEDFDSKKQKHPRSGSDRLPRSRQFESGGREVVEISTDDDILGSGPPWDIRPDDSLYRGRAGRSAVGSVQALRDVSPPSTRASRGSGIKPIDSGKHVQDILDGPHAPLSRLSSMASPRTPAPRPRPRPTPKPKKFKSAAVVVSSDDDTGRAPPSSGSPTPAKRDRLSAVGQPDDSPSESPPKKPRRAAPPPFAASFGTDDDMPTLHEVFKSMQDAKKKHARMSSTDSDGAVPFEEAYVTRLKKRATPPPPFFDDEAMEVNDDGDSVRSNSPIEYDRNDYDYADPFIDDTDVPVKVKKGRDIMPFKVKKEHGRNHGQTRFTSASVTPSARVPTDNRQYVRVKKEPVDAITRSLASPNLPRNEAAAPVSDGGVKGKGKGKSKANFVEDRSPAPLPLGESDAEHNTDEEGLSAHEVAQLREAQRLSLLVAKSRGGDSSRVGSSSTSPSKLDDRVPPIKGSSNASPHAATSEAPSTATVTPPVTKRRPRVTMADLAGRHAATAVSPEVPPPPPAPSPPEVTVEELSLQRRYQGPPDHDEVGDPSIQDEILRPSYANMPNRRRGRVVGWTTAAGTGRARFWAWCEQCPQMDGEMAYSAVTLVDSGNIRNPSRTDPSNIALRPMLPSTTRFNVYIYGPPATPLVAFSTGFVEHSQLVTPSNTGLRQRYIRLIFHTQEFEYFESFLHEITGLPEIHAQFARDAMQFSTRASASPSSGDGANASNQSRSLRTSPQKMFQTRPAGSGNRVLADNFSLPNDVVVPVYDARGVESFDFDTDLHRLERLPLFQGEIPYGSFAGVGYTMTIYKASNGNWTVGCNIQWVLLMGTPHAT